MGYRLYAHISGCSEEVCFGKLFGYRSEAADASSEALRYLLDNSDMIESYFEDTENKNGIASEVASMFDSSFQFRVRMSKREFFLFMRLYSIEAAKRWKEEGESLERCLNLADDIRRKAFSLASPYSPNPDFSGEIILRWR